MVVQDKIRSSLYTQLEQSFGADEAGLLMEALPPYGWSSLVTNDHLDARLAQVDARFEKVDARFDRVDARFDRVDARFDRVDGRLDVVDARLDTMVTKTRFEARLHQLDEHLSSQMVTADRFESRIDRLGRDFHKDQLLLVMWLGTIVIAFAGVMLGLVHVT